MTEANMEESRETEYAAIIPTLNAEAYIVPLITRLLEQTVPPSEILIGDSQSEDRTVLLAKAQKRTRVIPVDRASFDHGGTRDFLMRSIEAPYVLLLSQDALPENETFAQQLLESLRDERVAAVTARQIARPDAPLYEQEFRRYRYPDQSCVWNRETRENAGVYPYLVSDVCAMYRKTAYLAVGGFRSGLKTNEDMLIAADFLDAGYSLAYNAQARVVHSHKLTLRQEYRRNIRIGQFLYEYRQRFAYGNTGREGLRMMKTVTARLMTRGHFLSCARFWLDALARFAGNRAGRRLEKNREMNQTKGQEQGSSE